MQSTLDFDPSQFSDRVNRLILAKASEWGVTPLEAIARLLDRLATRSVRNPQRTAPTEPEETRPAA